MAKSNNQKAKILYLEKMLRETGEDRVVTMQEILAALTGYGISAERKSIYDDIEALRSVGMDIKFRRGRPGGYYLAGRKAPEASRPENAAEAVQPGQAVPAAAQPERTAPAGKPVPEAASVEQPQKASVEQPQKAPVEQPQKTPVEQQQKAREAAQESGRKPFEFRKEVPGEDGKTMKLLCDNAVEKAVKAYFGKDARYKEKELGYFTVTAQLMEGPQFYGWLTSVGKAVHILKPKKTAQGYREYLKSLVKEYKGV